MSRIINQDTAGNERRRLVRLVGLAIRELNSQREISLETKDLVAFIALSLLRMYESIDRSVEAWEKRGYWIKADRYRMEWEWTNRSGNKISASLLNEDWAQIANLTTFVAEKLGDIKLPKRNTSGRFWDGAMEALKQER